jgi:geranylgeranyl diphosphate synthase type II
MLVLAYDLLLDAPSGRLKDILLLFNNTARKVCEGQQMDMVFENETDVSIEDYIKMIGLKTAALLAGCLKMGAVLSGSSAANAELIYEFGYAIGTAFQLQDDLLDTYGDSAQFGKTIGGDIAANKKTFLALKAFELADGEQHSKLTSLYESSVEAQPEKVAEVIRIYDELDIKSLTEKARDDWYDKAMLSLEQIKADASGKEVLRKLADELINREK